MIKIGAFEAKTHLSSLLDKVSQGQEILITRHGKPIARLVPAQNASRAQIGKTIEELIQIRHNICLGSEDWKTLRDAGRR